MSISSATDQTSQQAADTAVERICPPDYTYCTWPECGCGIVGENLIHVTMPESGISNIELLKEAIRRIDKLALRPIWPKEAHYFSGVCKAGCITELHAMILELEGNGERIISGSAYESGKE